MKNIIIGVLVFVALIVTNIVMFKCYNSQRIENERLSSNIEAMRSDIIREISKDGKQTATISQQTLTKSELREILHEELKSMGIKERDVKQVINAGTESVADVPLTPSVTTEDTTSKREYKYNDEWIDLCVTGDSAHIEVRDSLLIANHAKTRRFLWWTWKRYSGKTTIKNYSPYSKITGIESIDIEK